MRTRVDPQLRAEARILKLRFTCEHCAFFEPDEQACAEGYPSFVHRNVQLSSASEIVFCKRFELV